MELRHLQYFVAVAEELHFGRAAQRLNMAQPPLSQQIRHLEEELGVQLFQRTRRHVELTDAGQAFLQEARLTLAQAEHAVKIARQAGRGEIGKLTIGFVGSATYEALPSIIRNFQARCPDVELILRELTTTQQVRALHDKRIHIGILRPPINDDTLVLETLIKEPIVLALPENHPLSRQSSLTVEALAHEHFILFPRHLGPGLYDQIIGLCQQGGFSPQVTQEAIQMQTILGLVATGLGIALIPASAQHLRSTGVIYRRLDTNIYVELAMARRKDDASPVLQAFLKIIWEDFSLL
ncbi:MAG TPA: LysR family transcriptional regulator [Ktedonobacteraceae bacterium]|nr:LysR family transcriptional regulator [Ktedonobacteraceae bacterium]